MRETIKEYFSQVHYFHVVGNKVVKFNGEFAVVKLDHSQRT